MEAMLFRRNGGLGVWNGRGRRTLDVKREAALGRASNFLCDLLFDFSHDVVQVFIPVQVGRPLVAWLTDTLGVFPYLLTGRAPSPGGKGIPFMSAATSPIGLSIGFPFAFWTSYPDCIHDLIKLRSKYNTCCLIIPLIWYLDYRRNVTFGLAGAY